MSEIRANTVSNAAGTGPATLTGQYAAKAWVKFNGTGAVAIDGSGNVSSITDVATGWYTVNFNTALPDNNYAPVTGIGGATGVTDQQSSSTSNFQIITRDLSNNQEDKSLIAIAVFR